MTLRLNSNIILDEVEGIILNKCERDNTFKNPEFISNEIHGRSNRNVESSIKTYHYEGQSLILPRGYVRDLITSFRENNITPQIIDERISTPCIYSEKLREIVLRPYQQRAVDSAMTFDQGTIVSPTGSGKSFIGLEIIRQHQEKALIIVHRSDLATQWKNLIEKQLGLKAGLIGGGSWEIGEQITIALIQTLSSRRKQFKEICNSFGLVLCDEVHHAPARTYFEVMSWLPAKYKYGLSATVERRDGLEQLIYLSTGPAILIIHRDEIEELGATVPVNVRAVETGFSPSAYSWHEYITDLTENLDRNTFIIKLAASHTVPILILCDRVAHAEKLSKMLSTANIDHVLAHGQVKNHSEIMEKVKMAQITIATTSLIGEGIDVSSWSILIMASPISSEIKLMQAIGRCVRPAPGKKSALVYDLRDNCGFSGSSFKKRFEIYKKHKIWVEFS